MTGVICPKCHQGYAPTPDAPGCPRCEDTLPLPIPREKCRHNKRHRATVSVNFLEDSGRFSTDIRLECGDCGRPFQFLGLPLGLDLGGAAMSVDGQEAHLAVAPVGEVPQPLDAGLVAGFRIRQPGDH